MSLRIVTDLFVNIDEFTKKDRNVAKSVADIAGDIGSYYAAQSILYFRELGGVVIVLAAAFTLAWMNHTNELTAILASGVSLRRVLAPIFLCALGMNVLIILDTELVIPRFGERIARDRDEAQRKDPFQVRLISDVNKSCLYSKKLDPEDGSMFNPLVIFRKKTSEYLGGLTAPRAVYRPGMSVPSWEFLPGKLLRQGEQDKAVIAEAPTVIPRLYMTGYRSKDTGKMFVPRMAPTTEFVPTSVSPANIIAAARAKAKRDSDEQVPPGATVTVRGVNVRDEKRYLTVCVRLAEFTYAKGSDGREKVVLKKLDGIRFEYGLEPDTPLVSIAAPSASYDRAYEGNFQHAGWALEDGRMFYMSELDPETLALYQSSSWLQYQSTARITQLLRLRQIPDRRRARLTQQSRIADFFNNILMLLLVGPFVLCRERNLKFSAGLAVAMGAGFFVFIYVTRSIAFQPVVAAWLPVLIFGPIAALQLESIKT